VAVHCANHWYNCIYPNVITNTLISTVSGEQVCYYLKHSGGGYASSQISLCLSVNRITPKVLMDVIFQVDSLQDKG